MIPRNLLVFFVCLFAAACRDGAADGTPAAKAVADANGMCAEHGLLEAVCTKCNPKLVPIFQAKGDWCAEHGFPESFCPTCHPERGGMPAIDVTPEEAPLNGTKIVLRTTEAVRAAGIEVAEASPPGEARLQLLATITYDALRRAEVNARTPGIVRELLVDVGTRVSKGTPLFRIESAELGATQASMRAARSRMSVAESARKRIESLLEKGMAADKDLLEAQLELDAAKAELATAESALGLVEIEDGSANLYMLLAPIDGSVIRHSAPAGRMVDAEETLCEIVDVSTMWAEVDVPESELARVGAGQSALITVEALPGREFAGTIDYVAPEVDPRTRTAKARVRLANGDGALRANMFARALITLAPNGTSALVPRDAVQRANDVDLVFLRLAPDRYEARQVKTGARRGDLVEVLEGLAPGVLVATRGSFLLKTEVLKGSIGSGCCEVE
ncbi:efflux RND transporter periplasmic adaptor subunit [Myxococcota bacterium]|nr:efflux RND transporter periplasmic adaptor subunit [Myxococcota bacterium]